MEKREINLNQPPVVNPSISEVAQAQRTQTRNGVTLYTLSSDDFEVFRVTFVFRAGSVQQSSPFVASSVANLLSEGTAHLTSCEIAEKLDYYGSWFDVNIDRDFSYISFCMLSKFMKETMQVAREILLLPSFPEEEIATYAQKRKQKLALERAKVDSRARELFAQSLFGKTHPYGVSYDEKEYEGLKRENLVSFYEEHYTAKDCFVVCSGHVGKDELETVREIAEALPEGRPHSSMSFPEMSSQKETFLVHEGAVQSSIRIGRILFERQHPDFVGMQVVATALGGYFGSRLMSNLREEHGFTYGVIAAMVNFEKTGYLAIGTQVGADVTKEALQEISHEIHRLRTELMPEEELSIVKNMMIGEMMRILDGPFGIADVTIENILCGKDNHSIEEQVREIRNFTPQRVRELAEKYLREEDLVKVVVGNQNPF